LTLTSKQLSREEEAEIGEEKEVRKEDQDKINRFSRLHSREKGLEEELKVKQVRTFPARAKSMCCLNSCWIGFLV
jgi:hypothetical protein